MPQNDTIMRGGGGGGGKYTHWNDAQWHTSQIVVVQPHKNAK